MILTGKAKQDFEKWLNLQEIAPYTVMFWNIPEIVQNAYIIDFFDSVGIYISIIKTKDLCQFVLEDDFKNYHQRVNDFNSKSEATAKAIEKANEIFNLKN